MKDREAMDRDAFVRQFGGVYEHSPWIAERAFDASEGRIAHEPTAAGLSAMLGAQFGAATRDKRMGVLRAHPDLAGKLASARRLTAESTAEQASAGLDALTDGERERFSTLNERYTKRFGHPFIIAVRGLDKSEILQAFERRIGNDAETEFATACAEVDKIARLRLEAMLP